MKCLTQNDTFIGIRYIVRIKKWSKVAKLHIMLNHFILANSHLNSQTTVLKVS